ncbi:hypothetical protein B0H14DRAFT_2562838 [Mycena olivaceomarginata]|nr:hypothetical protein B0H14DRAFT_2562838 [Mycena olivaceomarginata]
MSVRDAEYGDTVPLKLRATTDDTLYTHYSSLSTVQANWGLNALSNILSFIAAKTGYKNVQTVPGDVPRFNLTGVASGVLTSTAFTPFKRVVQAAAPSSRAPGSTRTSLPDHFAARESGAAEQGDTVADECTDDEWEGNYSVCRCDLCLGCTYLVPAKLLSVLPLFT